MSAGVGKKSPLTDDVAIVVLGVWGFLLQCLKSWQTERDGGDS